MFVPANVFPPHQAPARSDGSNASEAQMLPPGMSDSNDEDSDDDMYGHYPPYNTHSPAGSDRSYKQIDEAADEMDLDHTSPKGNVFSGNGNGNTQRDPPNFDLSHAIKGMYRILDLISEQGSGGLVDKIIISQDSLREFINTLCPGAYTSLTKVDFRALDNLMIKPMGVYGSRQEIVRFLLSIGAIDDAAAQKLLAAKDDFSGTSNPTLRSGLYIVRSFNTNDDGQLFVLYWPQETTWNDSAVSSVRRNRVTFIRYLTKLCDQITVLISSEHAGGMVWGDENDDDLDPDNEESDRLYTFEVAKTNEQEENVSIRPGFQVTSNSIRAEEVLADASADAESFTPRLLFGETKQGFITAKYIPSQKQSDFIKLSNITPLVLRSIVESGAIRFSDNLDGNAIQALAQCGLQDRFPVEYNAWVERQKQAVINSEAEVKRKEAAIKKKLDSESHQLEGLLREAIVDVLITLFPTLSRQCLGCPLLDEAEGQNVAKPAEQLSNVIALYPKIDELFKKAIHNATLDKIKCRDFQCNKERLMIYFLLKEQRQDLDPTQRQELIQFILKDDWQGIHSVLVGSNKEDSKRAKSRTNDLKSWWQNLMAIRSYIFNEDSQIDKRAQEAYNIIAGTSDSDFLLSLKDISADDDTLKAAITDTKILVDRHFDNAISKLLKKLVPGAVHIQQTDCAKQIQREASSQAENDTDRFRTEFIRKIEEQSQSESISHTHTIDSLEFVAHGYRSASYCLTGHRDSFQDPAMEFTVHLLQLTTEHQHTMQLDPSFVPSPNIQSRFSHSFRLPVGHNIEHGHLLESDRLLLVVADRDGKLFIFLDTLAGMDGAIRRSKYIKTLHRDKIGREFILAYEESKRMLILCACTKLYLHVFVFDENFGSLQASGSAVNLTPWYNLGITLLHACFICGSEELLLVDSSAQARIFSLITLQFRPAVLQLQQIPISVHSSPDGSCLVISDTAGLETRFTAYHWDTFGSTSGISLRPLGFYAADALVLTSFNRKSIHLMGLDIVDHQCRSVTLDITRKVTEFMFKEKGAKNSSNRCSGSTAHNCLIDCHAEVWTRFPVMPAVRRQTISSSSIRQPKTLVFVTDRDYQSFASHFADIIHTFEKTTKKPTGDELRCIQVSAIAFDSIIAELTADKERRVSCFRAGEWLVDCLCLIPIHIAITKENRFIPLKDGVSSAELEKSLLGAEVGRIVDSLSFGWYESLFQSYMASKPVKVVSSMGEQSVGKSFALNHLVDTSFAGSAMRTTEGVWMSVTPTDAALIVALDFEGVHSIERSAQEDTLLVLFNTAISNLVLFRNNFALSRDITGLFQSFQSSSTVLDPSANPSLFQSTLVIIIKDVVDSDKDEITREFSLKFQRIVEQEQDANFISRLHAGKLNIIPWPVIESKEFYKLFPTLKRRLDIQLMTHHTAGEFLNTLKTLMAKLKANDWGALSQATETMAAHRAQLLLTFLPNAMSTGFTEIEPELEQLKNFDTDIPVDKPDTSARFFLGGIGIQNASCEQVLTALRDVWDQADSRQLMLDAEWVSKLSAHLNNLVEMRVEHVREWITLNLSRFQTSHANIEELRRSFESATVDLKAGVQLCKAKCASCHLLCVQSRSHNSTHDCQTSHECIHVCDFCNDNTGECKDCTMSAGHPGKHICVVTAHLCGEPCKLSGKQGCLEDCTKVAGHMDNDHMCAASVHTCGKPCALIGMKLVDGRVYSCSGTCCIPCDEGHEQHWCDARLCPVTCQLCKRLCANQDHFHGLTSGAIHLCGQEHACTALCQGPGFCEIDTAPQSIEATFTGRHETFQYTKYSQVAKRLKCIKPIGPGATGHPGSHSHSTDPKAFHFCTTRCESCGYYCTLPLGHPQQEHETSHGSMSQTRWAVDGPDGTSLELRGRKYSSNDDGAPMMCNLVCLAMGRHVHIDYCRTQDGIPCDAAEVQHIPTRIIPDPGRLKDFVTHSLHWRRTGFKDPYPRDDQANFSKCDAMCGGPEHLATGGGSGQPSYCTLPMFHASQSPNNSSAGLGYVSNDGHIFSCKNPVVMQQAFHVIFVIDRSGSMSDTDRRPLANAPATNKIVLRSNNRLGAVYSALHSFWSARHAAVSAGPQTTQTRRDAYSVILFDDAVSTGVTNNFTSSPDQLLDAVLPYGTGGGTNFTMALRSARTVMEQNFSTERTPVIIFLSDGESNVDDQTVQDLCRSAVRLGKSLSFHAVSFGQDSQSSYLRRMTQIALDIQNNAPRDPLAPAAATVLSSYSQALDTVRLAETFLGIAESLRKPRGSLLR